SLMAQSRDAQSKTGTTAPARVSRFEDAFSGDVADTPAKKADGRSTKAAARTPVAEQGSSEEVDADESKSAGPNRTAKRKAEPKVNTSQSASRAAGLLRIGQNLERSGKTAAALDNYKRIVKDFADTPAAKAAKQRIEALQKP